MSLGSINDFYLQTNTGKHLRYDHSQDGNYNLYVGDAPGDAIRIEDSNKGMKSELRSVRSPYLHFLNDSYAKINGNILSVITGGTYKTKQKGTQFTVNITTPSLYYYHLLIGGYKPRTVVDTTLNNLGVRLMTLAELNDAFSKKGEWCSAGFLSDSNPKSIMQSAKPECGNSIDIVDFFDVKDAGANVVGKKISEYEKRNRKPTDR